VFYKYRIPAPASTSLQTEVARDICLQSMLDSTFRVVSVPSDYNSVYFGSTSGALRAFPGRELNLTQCTSYDPRWKPWYLNGVSVPRDFKILVDVGTSMGNSVTFEYNRIPGTTYLDVTKNITLTLLRALSPQDYVEVIIFNSSNATSLGGPFLVKSSFDYFNPFGHPELAALVAGVNNVFVSPMTEVASNLNGAIRKAAKSFNQLQSLKVMNDVTLNNEFLSKMNFSNLVGLWYTDGCEVIAGYHRAVKWAVCSEQHNLSIC
jgi:hypothetical protein